MHPFLDIISSRHCKRAFLDKPVPKEWVEQVIDAAKNAASSKNTQPWECAILGTQTMSRLSQIICEKFDKGESESPDYIYSPSPLSDTHQQRARDCGYALFKLKDIDKNDHKKRKAHTRLNFEFFGAPLAMIFHLPGDSEKGTFLDLGLFMQNIMLGFEAFGCASCPQASLTMYSQTIKSELKLDPSRLIVCGLSIGFPDPSSIVNSFVPERLPSSAFCQWFE